MTSDLQSQLLELRRSILSMGALVDERVQCVVDALLTDDLSGAENCRHGDREVDLLEVEIEKYCIEVLALLQPVARDLRFVLAVLRINTEFERIGDLAKGIAKRVLHLDKMGFLTTPEMVKSMARAVRTMLADTIASLANSDANLAQQIRRGDQEIDDFQKQILEWAQRELLSKGTATEAAIDIMTVARSLERIGDLCTNVAEDIIFLLQGEVVRHSDV
jgi:phosphate transport system protein